MTPKSRQIQIKPEIKFMHEAEETPRFIDQKSYSNENTHFDYRSNRPAEEKFSQNLNQFKPTDKSYSRDYYVQSGFMIKSD